MAIIKKIVKYLYFRWKYNKSVKIAFSAEVSINSVFEPMCQVHSFSSFYGKMGMGSYIGPHSTINAEIGRFVSIAGHVKCVYDTHVYQAPFVSSSPCFFSLNTHHLQCGATFATEQMFKEHRFVDEKQKISIKIGNDVWIGDEALLIGGITIGDGAVVLARAVVTKDVPPYAIVGGVPARIIRYRYNDETITWLLNIRWWNHSKLWFENHWRLMTNIDELKKYLNNNP